MADQITIDRAVVQQALSWIHYIRREYGMDEPNEERALRAALAQAEPVPIWQTLTEIGASAPAGTWDALEQADPDHETRAEVAEQQVVQLAEERDHYRRLWQKAQQADPVQEPVAWGSGDGYWILAEDKSARPDRERFTIAFYTAPPQRKPLTEDEIDKLMQSIGLRCADEGNPLMMNHAEWQRRTIARAIEAAHGIKEAK